MWQQLMPALRMNLFATLLFGLIYPLGITGICQLLFPHRANGSLVRVGDRVVGSELIGQNFAKPQYFHPRPSAAGNGYDAASSGGSNLGPTSAKLIQGVAVRMVHFCLENDLPYESSAPLDQFKDAKGDVDDAKL